MRDMIEVVKTDGYKATIFVDQIAAICEISESYERFIRIFTTSGQRTYIDTTESYEEVMKKVNS